MESSRLERYTYATQVCGPKCVHRAMSGRRSGLAMREVSLLLEIPVRIVNYISYPSALLSSLPLFPLSIYPSPLLYSSAPMTLLSVPVDDEQMRNVLLCIFDHLLSKRALEPVVGISSHLVFHKFLQLYEFAISKFPSVKLA